MQVLFHASALNLLEYHIGIYTLYSSFCVISLKRLKPSELKSAGAVQIVETDMNVASQPGEGLLPMLIFASLKHKLKPGDRPLDMSPGF